MHSSTEPISALQELRAVYVWRLEVQVSGSPSQMTKPAIERVLKRSSSIGEASGEGTDWSCGPHLALVNGVMIDGFRGNWTKDSIFELFLLENWIPRSDVPLTYLTESIWPGKQLLVY